MKKKIQILSILLLVVLTLISCNTLTNKRVKLQQSITIPEDGIIECSVFEDLKENNSVVTFKGSSNCLSYEWTVFGSDIDIPKSLNLGIEIIRADDTVLFQYKSTEDFGFSPVLTVYLNNGFDADTATVYDKTNGSDIKLCHASITGRNGRILNFSPSGQRGICEIVPDKCVIPDITDIANTGIGNVNKNDPYLSGSNSDDQRVISDGSATGQDKYKTDPVPTGKPMPVEPEDQKVDNKKKYTCTFSIECSTILNNIGDLEPEKLDVLPSNGIIFPEQTVTFYEGESVFDVLQRVCRENNIHMEASWTPMYNSAYIEGIHNLYEFDCGSGSGWMYRVDGWYPNYGCSRYSLRQGEKVEWRYTCDLGSDIGGGYAIGS